MPSIRKIFPFALAIGLAASPVLVMSAAAQEAAPATPPTVAPAPPAAQAAEYDETKLKSFVVAFLEVNKVGQQYQPQLQANANNEAERTRLREEANTKMVEAVENANGITVEEYTSILNTAQSNPELAQQINTMIREETQEQAPAAPAQ